MGWFHKKKEVKSDPVYTYYGDKDPTMAERIAVLIEDPRFVGLNRINESLFKITIRTWSSSSMQNVSYSETLERVMNWAANELGERKQNGNS